MRIRRALLTLILAAGSLVPSMAWAQNLITNGSFEAGSIAGWTATGATCTFESLNAGVATAGAGAFVTPTPANGTFAFMSDANLPGSCTFFQDVVLTGTTSALSFSAGYGYTNFGNPAAPGCSASVQVTDTAGTRVFATAFTAFGGTSVALAPHSTAFSLAAGSTVRVIVTMVSCADGPVGIALDNVVLAAVPAPTRVATLSEWAMALLVLLMAGIAAGKLRRREAVRH